MTLKSLVVAVVVLAFSVPVWGQQSSAGEDKGSFIEGSVGVTIVSIDVLGVEENVISGAGVNATGGYYFHRNWAVEGGYTYYEGDEDGDLNAVHVGMRGVLFLGQEDRWELFGKLGPAVFFVTNDDDEEEDNSKIWFLGGVGVGYRVTDNLDLNVQWQGTTTGFFGLGMASVGLGYRF